jgi:hypothetical protein
MVILGMPQAMIIEVVNLAKIVEELMSSKKYTLARFKKCQKAKSIIMTPMKNFKRQRKRKLNSKLTLIIMAFIVVIVTMKVITLDALLSPLLNPLEGSTM